MFNKKAQIAQTITWIIAFLIIFFILILFLGATAVLSKNKILKRNNIYFQDGALQKSLESQRGLITLLNTPIDYNGKNEKVKDVFLELLNPYTKEEGDINEMYLVPKGREWLFGNKILIVEDGKEINKEDEELKKINSLLIGGCYNYILKTPFGYFYSYMVDREGANGFKEKTVSEEWNIALGSPEIVEIPYKNKMIKFELKGEYEC